MNKTILVVALIFSLSGCAINNMANKIASTQENRGKIYKDPIEGPTANVRVFMGDSGVSIYPNSSKIEDIRLDKDQGQAKINVQLTGFLGFGERKYTQKLLGMPFAPKNTMNYGEFKVPTEKPIIVGMGLRTITRGNYNISCPYNYYLIQFETNKNYMLDSYRDEYDNCHYVISQYLDDGKLSPLKDYKLLKKVN